MSPPFTATRPVLYGNHPPDMAAVSDARKKDGDADLMKQETNMRLSSGVHQRTVHVQTLTARSACRCAIAHQTDTSRLDSPRLGQATVAQDATLRENSPACLATRARAGRADSVGSAGPAGARTCRLVPAKRRDSERVRTRLSSWSCHIDSLGWASGISIGYTFAIAARAARISSAE